MSLTSDHGEYFKGFLLKAVTIPGDKTVGTFKILNVVNDTSEQYGTNSEAFNEEDEHEHDHEHEQTSSEESSEEDELEHSEEEEHERSDDDGVDGKDIKNISAARYLKCAGPKVMKN